METHNDIEYNIFLFKRYITFIFILNQNVNKKNLGLKKIIKSLIYINQFLLVSINLYNVYRYLSLYWCNNYYFKKKFEKNYFE